MSFIGYSWLDDAADTKASLPFGAGPRTCPGRYLALLEIKVAMAMLLARFDILYVTAHRARKWDS